MGLTKTQRKFHIVTIDLMSVEICIKHNKCVNGFHNTKGTSRPLPLSPSCAIYQHTFFLVLPFAAHKSIGSLQVPTQPTVHFTKKDNSHIRPCKSRNSNRNRGRRSSSNVNILELYICKYIRM